MLKNHTQSFTGTRNFIMKSVYTLIFAVLLACTMPYVSFSAQRSFPLSPVSLLLLGEKAPIYQCKARLLADLNGPGNVPYAKRAHFTDLGNLTLFFADHPDTGVELWVTDGTPGGTHIVKDINPGPDDSITWGDNTARNIVRVGDKVYFIADDGIHGEELWVTDGTASGTNLVLDINPGSSDAWIKDLTEFNNKLYFLVGNTGLPLFENQGLWVSEGTAGTTRVVASPPIVGTWSGEESGTMIVFNNNLFFAASGDDKGYELWKSDGISGASLVKDINPGLSSSGQSQYTVVGNKLYFMAHDDIHGREVWVSDGTTAGTRMVKDIYPGEESGAIMINIDQGSKINPGFQDKLYFLGNSPGYGVELWVTDGTEAGTKLVRDIYPGPGSPFGSYPYVTFNSGEVFNNRFYFVSHDQSTGDDNPYEEEAIWRVNGDGSATIQMFTGLSAASYLTANDDYLFFCTGLGRSQGRGPSRELGIMDKEGRTRVLDIFPGIQQSWPEYLHIRNDQSLLFVTNNYRYAPGVGLYQVTCPVETDQNGD
jgi:ELWxxDGT repeat protein